MYPKFGKKKRTEGTGEMEKENATPTQPFDTEETIERTESTGDHDMQEPTQDEWSEALKTAVQQRDEYLDMAQRTTAEFANYRRRTEKTRTEGYDDGVRDVLTRLLPVIDTLERGIDAANSQGEEGAIVDGIKMTYKLLMDELSAVGFEEVPALGEMFDPDLHNAVMRASEGEPGTVLEVFQKGFRVKGRIIRYAMVKVAAE